MPSSVCLPVDERWNGSRIVSDLQPVLNRAPALAGGAGHTLRHFDSETFSRMNAFASITRRRRFTTERKFLVVNKTLQLGMSVSCVACRRGSARPQAFGSRPSDEDGRRANRMAGDTVFR